MCPFALLFPVILVEGEAIKTTISFYYQLQPVSYTSVLLSLYISPFPTHMHRLEETEENSLKLCL